MRALVLAVSVGLLAVGCAGTASPTAERSRGPVVSADALRAAREVTVVLEQLEAGWDAKDPDAILSRYSEDARITDAAGGWWDEPRATVERMVRESLGQWPDLAGLPETFYVDTTGGADESMFWGMMGVTESRPLHEVDTFEISDGLLSSQHVMYDINTLKRIGGRGDADTFLAMQALVQSYVEAWSSADPSLISALYADTASRANRLWGESADSRQLIADAAVGFSATFPGATWEIGYVFGAGRGDPTTGGLIKIHLAAPDSCALEVAVVLETDDAGKVIAERLYWGLGSLEICGLT